MLKAAVLFGDAEYLNMFHQARLTGPSCARLR
jgi:hypothetical protein